MQQIYQDISDKVQNILDQKLNIEFLEPDQSRGDVAFACFPFAKVFRKSPQIIAQEIAERLSNEGVEAIPENGFVNIRLNSAWLAQNIDSITILPQIKKKLAIEFVSPNTNKPLHLGHMRNMALGESVARIYESFGYDVVRTILINDRGIAICKSMLAYQKFHDGEDPNKKGDHYVGTMYVEYSKNKTDELESEARQMLLDWEAGDEKTVALWRKMNDWVLSGHQETYQKAGVTFDEYTYESNIYKEGREKILEGLKNGVFKKHEEGYVYADLEDQKLGKKVLLRSDGTSLYITQDISLVFQRFQDQSKPTAGFDTMVYVTAYEQDLAFKQLFAIANLLGLPKESLHHLSYGMVNLPEGRMKSREGTVVDADDLISQIESMIKEKFDEMQKEGATMYTPQSPAEERERITAIAKAAYNFYLLLPAARKDMVFDKNRSIELKGKTGPYIQYTYARLCALLDDFDSTSSEIKSEEYDFAAEHALLAKLARFTEYATTAKDQFDPSVLAQYTYQLAETINTYYHKVPVKKEEEEHIRHSRQYVLDKAKTVLRQSMHMLHIPQLEKM